MRKLNYIDLVEEIKSSDNEIIVFGAGKLGKIICNKLNEVDIYVNKIFDNYDKKNGTVYKNIPIVKPISKEDGLNCLVIITIQNYNDLIEQLEGLRYRNYIYVYPWSYENDKKLIHRNISDYNEDFIKCMESNIIFENSYYKFSFFDFWLGNKILNQGYDIKNKISMLSKNEFELYEIDEYKFYQPKDAFKPGELEWLYYEVCGGYMENPHAYETDNIYIENGDVVFDLGACEGFFVKYALDKHAKKIYAFEPVNELKNSLEMTYDLQIKEKKVTIENIALSNCNENRYISYDNKLICEAKIGDEGNEIVKTISLDKYVEENNIEELDFIKADIEGEEINFIKGALNTIRKFKPKLAIAIYHEFENGFIIKNLVDNLELDYKIEFRGCWIEEPYRPFMIFAYPN